MDGLNPRQSHRISLALAFLACAPLARAQVAPPPAPPVISSAPFSIETTESTTAQLYSIGDPTNEEQYYLELINRARANPTAEGIRMATTTDSNVLAAYSAFGVNLVLRGSRDRLSPILMTTLATALALVPLVVLGSAPGHEIEHPTAVVIVGGLVTSTLLNLVVVPAMYLWVAGLRRRKAPPVPA